MILSSALLFYCCELQSFLCLQKLYHWDQVWHLGTPPLFQKVMTCLQNNVYHSLDLLFISSSTSFEAGKTCFNNSASQSLNILYTEPRLNIFNSPNEHIVNNMTINHIFLISIPIFTLDYHCTEL